MFERAITLPETVDSEQVEATLDQRCAADCAGQASRGASQEDHAQELVRRQPSNRVRNSNQSDEFRVNYKSPAAWLVQVPGSCSFFVQGPLLVEFAIALVPCGVDLSAMDGVLDGAAGFVGVRAIGKMAVGDVGAKLDEVTLELARHRAPELELAEPGRVDDETARFEVDQLGGRGGVLALGGPVRHLTHLEVQTGLDGIQERALADSALAGDRGHAGREQLAEAIETAAVGRRCDERLVAQSAYRPITHW